ncbi:metal ABC transporter substrate-binding protein [Ornithinicoccus halotolerans]|uniref:metal ABC transporter substrate-binding protein n=1 Tax=Ornithinicoccus halotolerans TaxID=1748220 RepID=UPI0012962429|nr:zinc ABC transporter substrate-binding protein [Ornithinicoccus halotolerans]
MTRSRALLPALLTAGALLAGCGEGAPGGSGEAAGGAGGSLTVTAGFYPLEFAVEQVGGELVEVVPLTATGVDPHDLELSPRTVAELGDADLVVYAAGMQPALDQAVAQQAPDRSLDVTGAADLVVTGTGDDHASHDEHEDDHAAEEGADGHDHAAEGGDGHAHDQGGQDPHFWLDTERYGAVTTAVAERLAELDPDHAEQYRDNAEAMMTRLQALDEEFATGLADCASDTVVTSHAAFGYLTDRYGLQQVAITGLSPEAEPTPARMAEISREVEEHGVDAVYGEVLFGEELAEAVATETGAQVLLLDPLEGLTDASPGSDYFEVMRANLAALQDGLGCA